MLLPVPGFLLCAALESSEKDVEFRGSAHARLSPFLYRLLYLEPARIGNQMSAKGYMQMRPILQLVLAAVCLAQFHAAAASVKPHFYAHDAVADSNGVIAPWHKGLNGQCNLRVRIAAETLNRYPWITTKSPSRRIPPASSCGSSTTRTSCFASTTWWRLSMGGSADGGTGTLVCHSN